MALTFPKRGFSGYAVAGTLNAPGLSSSDSTGVTFTSSTTLTGWVDVTGGTFSGANICVTFGYGTSTEEKILCTFNTSTSTFTIVTRGYEGGTAQTWATGSLFVMTSTATEAAELNAVTQTMKTILTNSGTTTTPQPITVGSGTGSVGTGTQPAAIDHDHKISSSTLNGFLSGSSASATLGSNLLIPLANLVSGALPAAVTSSKIWSASGTGASPAGITNITGYNNYIIVAAHIWTSGANAGENSANITANAQTPAAAVLYARSTGTTGNHVSGISFTTGEACGVTARTPLTTFNASVVANQVTGTSNTHTLFVIGLN